MCVLVLIGELFQGYLLLVVGFFALAIVVTGVENFSNWRAESFKRRVQARGLEATIDRDRLISVGGFLSLFAIIWLVAGLASK